MECGGINPVAPPRRKKKEARLLEIPQVDKSTGNLPSNAIHSKTASRCDIRGESPSTGSPNAGIYATVSKSVNGKLQSKGQIAESEPKSLHRPPVSSRAVRNSSSKEAENVKGSRNETFNGITSTEDANKEDGYAVPNSPIIPGKTALHSNASESPKKKPARPERPKRYVSKDASSKPAPHSPAPHSSGQHSPTATVLQAAYGSPVNSSILRSRAEGEFTIIDSRVKALERRASKDEEQVKGDILSPTRRTARPPTPPAKLSSYKEQIQKTPHEASIGSGIRSAAQTFISKIKASTLPRGLSSSGQTKSSHPPPEKPPRPAPPPSDRIYATVNRATDSESSPYSPIYSYISCDLKWNRNIANKSVSLPANSKLHDRPSLHKAVAWFWPACSDLNLYLDYFQDH